MTGATLKTLELEGLLLKSDDIVFISLAGREAVCNVTVGAGAFAFRGAGVPPDDSVHAVDFKLPCSRDGIVLGVLNACHWLPLQNGRTTWRVDGMAVATVTGLRKNFPPNPMPNT